MKKLLQILLVTILAIQISTSVSNAWSGSGTSSDPWQVTTLTELQDIDGYTSSGKYWILMNDIDASATSSWNSGAGFDPIGNSSFYGNFDGQGYVISNLNINRSTTDSIGLFSVIDGATIQNVRLLDADISGNHFVGILSGRAYNSTITNCFVDGDVSLTSQYGGGLIGFVYASTITNCHTSGSVTGSSSSLVVGGLCGRADKSTISNSHASVDVYGSDRIGGFLGTVGYTGSVTTNCYATGSATGVSLVGGFVAWNYSGSNMSKCYSTGEVNGTGSNVGGFCGLNYATITDCYWDTQTSGKATSSGGTGKTTAQMKQQATFSGWDFTNTWFIIEDDIYPLLDVDSIPTLTEWAAIFMGVLLAGFGVFFIFRRLS